jgi:class 3 adenylate cyclase
MTAVSEVRYADAEGVQIAYQVIGDRGPTFVGIPGLAQNIELLWDEPHSARFLRRFGSFCRLLHFDKRGTGLSDRNVAFSSFPERVRDLEAVMAAEDVEHAFVGGFSEGGLMSAYFAATHPERVDGLVLLSTAPSFTRRANLPWNLSQEDWVKFIDAWGADWGKGTFTVSVMAPSMAEDPEYLRWMARYERQSLQPAGLVQLQRLNGLVDISELLGSITVPTVVIHHDQEAIRVDNGRYLAASIPGARYVELTGRDHLPWIGDQDAVLDAIEEFVTGHPATAATPDRILSTVVFTDIVDSTRRAVQVGDAAWRRELDAHDDLSAAAVGRHGGTLVKSTGDGLLATFDSPSRALGCCIELSTRSRSIELELRCGVHTGEIERRGQDVGGVAVHIASRVEACAGPGEVLATRTVRDLSAGAPFRFEPRGSRELKGLPGEWELYSVSPTP